MQRFVQMKHAQVRAQSRGNLGRISIQLCVCVFVWQGGLMRAEEQQCCDDDDDNETGSSCDGL